MHPAKLFLLKAARDYSGKICRNGMMSSKLDRLSPFFQNNEYIQSVARCLQMMLRINEYRLEFVRLDGIGAIVSVLSGRINFQIQYQVQK
jgi:hypothetical protein